MTIETMETIFDSYMSHLITWEEAIELLQNHCDMDTEEAEGVVEAWDCNKAEQKFSTQ